MSTLATAYVQIMPSAGGLGEALTTTLKGEASSAGDAAGSLLGDNLVGKLKGIIAAAGIGVAIKEAIAGVDAVAKAGDNIDKTSQKMGVSAQQFQAMAFAAEHCGFSTSTFNTAVKKLQASGYEGTIADYMNGLMAIEDPAERAAKAQEDLGERTANEMAAFINGGQTLDEYQKQLESLGGMMSDDAVKASAAYADAMTDMHAAIDGVKTNLAMGLMPTFSQVMTGVAQLVSGDEGGLETIKTALSDLVGNIVEKAPEFMAAAGELLLNIVEGIKQHLPELLAKGIEIVQNMLLGIKQNLPAVGQTILNVIAKILATIGQNLPQILQKGMELLGKLIVGILRAIPQIPGAIMQVISSIRQAFSGYDWGSIGRNIIQGLKNGLSSAAGAVIETIKGICRDALSAVKAFFGIHSPSRVMAQMGGYISEGLAIGILNEAGAVEDAMDSLNVASMGAFDGNVSVSRSDSNTDRMISLMGDLIRAVEDGKTIKLDSREVGRMVRSYA